MQSRPEALKPATRCAMCDGQFGLVRYQRWRTPLCSKKCVARYRTRLESDRNWLSWLLDPLPASEEHSASGNLEPVQQKQELRPMLGASALT